MHYESSPTMIMIRNKVLFLLRRNVGHFLILLCLPLILCVINDNWIFNPVSFTQGNNVDPWLYNGLFARYPDLSGLITQQGNFYFIARIAWNALGYAFYHLFSPLTSNYILHLCVCYLAVFSFYGILRAHISRNSALFSAMLMSTYPWFLTAVGYDYTDGYSIAIFLFLTFLIVLALRRHCRFCFFLAGMLYSINLNMNLSLAGFLPVIALYTVWMSQRSQKPIARLVGYGIQFVGGMLLGFAALGVLYYSFTGSFDYWTITLRSSRQLAALFQTEATRRELYAAYGRMPPNWHILPLVLALASTFYLTRVRTLTPNQHSFILFTTTAFAATYGYWILLHFVIAPYLIIYLYSSYTMPATFLLLGCLIDIALKSQGRHIIDLALLAVPLFVVTLFPQVRVLQQTVSIMLVCVLLLLLALQIRFRWLFAGAFAALGFLGSPSNPVYSDRGTGRANFSSVRNIMDVIDVWLPDKSSLQSTWLWNTPGDQHGLYVGLGYGFYWGRLINNQVFPAPDGTRVIILAARSIDISQFRQQIQQMGGSLEINGEANTLEYRVYDTLVHYRIGHDFDRKYEPVGTTNIYYPEPTPDGGLFFWTGPGEEVIFPLDVPVQSSNVYVDLCLRDAHTPNFPHDVELSLGGHVIPIQVTKTDECFALITGEISSAWLEEMQNQQLRIDAKTTLVGTEAYSRRIGIAIDWIRFRNR